MEKIDLEEIMAPRLSIILGVYVFQIPFYLVWLAGLILAIVFWKRHPKASLLAVIGLAGIFLLNVISVYTSTFLSMDLYTKGLSTVEIGRTLSIRTIVSNILTAGCWGLVIASIFVGRKQASVIPQIPNRF